MNNNNLFEIVEIKKSDNPSIRKITQICDLTSHKKSIATLCIKYVGNKKLGSSIFINDETFYQAIANADEDIKKNILKILTPKEQEKEKKKTVKQEVKKIVEEVKEEIKEEVEEIKEKVKKVVAKKVATKKPVVKKAVKKTAKKTVKKVKAVVKEKVEDIIEDVIEVKKYILTEKDGQLLDYNIEDLEDDDMVNRYWKKLSKLADNLKLDYTNIEVKDCKALRELFKKSED